MSTNMDVVMDEFKRYSQSNRKRGKKPRGIYHTKGGSQPRGTPNNQDNSKPGGSVQRGRARGGITKNVYRLAQRPQSCKSRELTPSKTSSHSVKLFVSNLDFDVNDQVLREIFAEFRSLNTITMHHSGARRSLLSAEVVFGRKPDAAKAMKKYNGVSLRGYAMKIQMSTLTNPPQSQLRAERSCKKISYCATNNKLSSTQIKLVARKPCSREKMDHELDAQLGECFRRTLSIS